MHEPPSWWFPAKRYGWGWGPPCRWQGWVVLGIWFGVVLAAAPRIALRQGAAAVVGFVTLMSLVLMGICWLTGEPPRWRWGDQDRGGGPHG